MCYIRNTFTSHHDIRFYDEYISTTVTNNAFVVDRWIGKTLENKDRFHVKKLIIGLDTEWCLPTKTDKHQKVAILQLCVGHRCLIFQLCHRDMMPRALQTFFGNDDHTFVGKEVKNDAVKLFQDYGLSVAKVEDLAEMAASKYNDEAFRKLGLKGLALNFLNADMEKSKKITLSKWDRKKLSDEQIQYAAIDAFVSFKVGLELKKPLRENEPARTVVGFPPF